MHAFSQNWEHFVVGYIMSGGILSGNVLSGGILTLYLQNSMFGLIFFSIRLVSIENNFSGSHFFHGYNPNIILIKAPFTIRLR